MSFSSGKVQQFCKEGEVGSMLISLLMFNNRKSGKGQREEELIKS